MQFDLQYFVFASASLRASRGPTAPMFRRLARACAAASARCASSSSSSSSSTACFASTALPRASASRPRDAAPRASQKPAQLYVARRASPRRPRIAHGADKKTKLTPENSIEVTFVERDGERRAVRGLIGENCWRRRTGTTSSSRARARARSRVPRATSCSRTKKCSRRCRRRATTRTTC